MFEKPLNQYEVKERSRESAIRDAINKKLFQPAVIILMIKESSEKMLWIEKYIENKDLYITDLITAINSVRPFLKYDQEFMRRILISTIKREDCPKQTALEYATESFPDIKDKEE